MTEANRNRGGRSPMLVAHRGLSSRAPENTMGAVRLALEAGVSWVEVDVQLSADDRVVVIHDRTLQRTTTGNGPVRAYSYPEIQQLDAGSWFDRAFSDERVPLLGDILSLAGRQCRLMIEVKTFLFGQTSRREIAERVIADITASKADSRVMISSFDRSVLRTIRTIDDAIPLGVLAGWPRNVLQSATRFASAVRASAVICARHQVRTSLVGDAHDRGLDVFAYTVNDIPTAERLGAMGVDAIISDSPDALVGAVPRPAI